jgi:hypothetical protein
VAGAPMQASIRRCGHRSWWLEKGLRRKRCDDPRYVSSRQLRTCRRVSLLLLCVESECGAVAVG